MARRVRDGQGAHAELHRKEAHQAPVSGSGTQAIDRATAFLRQVATQQRGGVSLAEMVAHLKVSRPTTFRIASCLEQQGLLYREPATRRYFLGDFFANLSGGIGPHERLRRICAEPIRRLAEDTGDTVYLIVRVGDDGRCIVCNEGSFGVRIVTIDVGTQRPLGVGGGGLAILAALESGEQDAIIERNAHRYGLFGNITEKQLRRAIASARRREYAINAAQAALGVKSMARAVRNVAGEPIAAVSISSVTRRIDGRIKELDKALSAATEVVEAALAVRPA